MPLLPANRREIGRAAIIPGRRGDGRDAGRDVTRAGEGVVGRGSCTGLEPHRSKTCQWKGCVFPPLPREPVENVHELGETLALLISARLDAFRHALLDVVLEDRMGNAVECCR